MAWSLVEETRSGRAGSAIDSATGRYQVKALRLILMIITLAAVTLGSAGTALAASYVQDTANMFSASARDQANAQIAQIQQQTGKTIRVITVPALNGADINTAADQAFRQSNLNGVLIYIARDNKQLAIKVGQNTRQYVSSTTETSVRDTMLADFRAGRFDQGLLDGVSQIGQNLRTGAAASGRQPRAPSSGGINWLTILLVVGGIALVIWLVSRLFRPRPPASEGFGPQLWNGGGGWSNPGGYNQGGYSSGGFPGGGFLSGIFGGIAGSFVGNWLWNRFNGPPGGYYQPGPYENPNPVDFGQAPDQGIPSDSPADTGSWGDAGGGDTSGSWGDSGSGDSSGSW